MMLLTTPPPFNSPPTHTHTTPQGTKTIEFPGEQATLELYAAHGACARGDGLVQRLTLRRARRLPSAAANANGALAVVSEVVEAFSRRRDGLVARRVLRVAAVDGSGSSTEEAAPSPATAAALVTSERFDRWPPAPPNPGLRELTVGPAYAVAAVGAADDPYAAVAAASARRGDHKTAGRAPPPTRPWEAAAPRRPEARVVRAAFWEGPLDSAWRADGLVAREEETFSFAASLASGDGGGGGNGGTQQQQQQGAAASAASASASASAPSHQPQALTKLREWYCPARSGGLAYRSLTLHAPHEDGGGGVSMVPAKLDEVVLVLGGGEGAAAAAATEAVAPVVGRGVSIGGGAPHSARGRPAAAAAEEAAVAAASPPPVAPVVERRKVWLSPAPPRVRTTRTPAPGRIAWERCGDRALPGLSSAGEGAPLAFLSSSLSGPAASAECYGKGATATEMERAARASLAGLTESLRELREALRSRREAEKAAAASSSSAAASQLLCAPFYDAPHWPSGRGGKEDGEGEDDDGEDGLGGWGARGDYLAPFLDATPAAAAPSPSSSSSPAATATSPAPAPRRARRGAPLPADRACAVRDAYLNALRERLDERGSLIRDRLRAEEEAEEAARRQQAAAAAATTEREEEQEAKAAAAAATDEEYESKKRRELKLSVLRRRLEAHEAAAAEKLREAEARLAADPRLSLAR